MTHGAIKVRGRRRLCHRPTDIKSLHIGAVQGLELPDMRGGFRAFGNHIQVQGLPEPDQDIQNDGIATITVIVAQKALIDLQYVIGRN